MPPVVFPRALLALALTLASGTSGASATPADLTELSLSDLMSIDITSVSKHLEPLSDAAAAVYVLTNEQLVASGASNIAEALRGVPGVQVARVDARAYAVSVRGFNSNASDKLEVRLDGRSVYTPLFSGVFWDVFETDLADVERIEIIRGPGATLYGANAVNGVINIITKSAQASPGGRLRVGAGNEERAMVAVRQSFKLGSGALRANALGHWRDDTAKANGSDMQDGARFSQAGLRGDWQQLAGGSLSTGANAYDARFQGPAGNTSASGQSVQGRWARPTAAGERSLQFAYEHYERNIPTIYNEQRNTANLDFEEQRSLGTLNQLVYGLGLHYTQDKTAGPPLAVIFTPASRTLNTYSAFVQDQLPLTTALTLTLGSKFEHNDVTGFEAQPSIRLGWRARPEAFVWGSVARAVRTPNRLDQDVAIFCPPPNGFPGACGPGSFRIGNPQLKSETVIAYEAGTRLALAKGLSADLALFHNDYQKLKSTEPMPPFGAYANRLEGVGEGGELALSWQASERLRFQGSYSLLSLRIHHNAESRDTTTPATINGSSPRHQLDASLNWRFAPNWQFYGDARYLSRQPAQHITDRADLSLRIGYTPTANLTIALSGENLLQDQHAEFGANVNTRSEVQRSGWLTLTRTWP